MPNLPKQPRPAHPSAIRRAWTEERALARQARSTRDRAGEWVHLERAHILSQPLAAAHIRTHLAMLFLPWYSSGDGDFNYDFGVTIDASRGFDEFNFRTLDEYAAMGQESMKTSDQPYDMPGQSCFLQVDGRVFHTYSVYARGLESTGGSYYFLDNTALGRQEDWEEPKGRAESARGAVPDFAS